MLSQCELIEKIYPGLFPLVPGKQFLKPLEFSLSVKSTRSIFCCNVWCLTPVPDTEPLSVLGFLG